MKLEQFRTNPYEDLANAIIIKACNDYRYALSCLKFHPHNKDYLHTVVECEQFFRSVWFSKLTLIDGEYLIRRLKNDVCA